ncbi:MAG: ABC transporter ATP-binding protein [Leptospiraceae bacterium]|nr:ABC transporter ATP-binding protein [Leptospiraceae bacterium]MDW7977145.1 ABC transporter ATP-binding protein [Leptospiraceae bacterium]
MNEYVIELIDLHKSFDGRPVLQGVNLQIRRGETMVILGGSGTGKSVTMRHIVGLTKPDKGDVKVFGKSIVNCDEKTLSEIRSRIGVLFQSGALINWLTVFDNVALPLREHRLYKEKEIEKIVLEKLDWLGLLPAKDLLPDSISGGMKKRVGIARALTTNPEILLYDEPTSGLDPVMSQVINELIRKLQRELHVTQVVVTHDMNSAYYVADRITFLYKGRVEMIGTPEEIQKTDNLLIQQFIQGKTEGPLEIDAGDPTKRKKT